MSELVDPVQRHIFAIAAHDTIVPDDASDLKLDAIVPAKQLARLRRAMLPGVDHAGAGIVTALDDPVGRRVGRVAFAPPLQALFVGGCWTGIGPAPHCLPDSAVAVTAFHYRQTRLAEGRADDDARVKPLLGFSIAEHAGITDMLRTGGARARLFIAASMLSAAGVKYEKARQRTGKTGRQQGDVNAAAMAVEAALIGVARIATDILLNDLSAPRGIHRIAAHLVDQVEAARRRRSKGDVARAVRIAATAADAVHLWLTRQILRDVPANEDREGSRFTRRLAVTNSALAETVNVMIDEVGAVETHGLYVWLMARRLEVALGHHRWLAAPHPVFRLSYGYVGGHALFAEIERVGAIAATMARRESMKDGAKLDNVTLKPVLDAAAGVQGAIAGQDAPGRYLDLGAYHRAVTTGFIGRRSHWMATTVPAYTHHAYALGSRFCDLAAAAGHGPTHGFIRSTELDKPSEGTRRQPLVLFYGLDIEEMVILGLRQILDRLIARSAGSDAWRTAFGRTVHHVLQGTAPSIAARLEMSSCLKTDLATCKGIANRATALAGRFDDRDHERPMGMVFDYALWFHRDHDVAFWDRLQRGAKLYRAFGSAFIPIEREPVPGRQGRRATPADAPPSAWQRIMTKAKTAFDAYQPLYLKSRPSLLTARIMARMCEGYSAISSDPQFLTVFRG
ncbi:hypothetical protein M9980_09680 [Sphingomonas donggukensis]|uniref:Acyl-CoA dehydrogenase n=1 Tax=Sphingomonas donggukensis TaxID=2949093 RepID=A0ABY4TSZ9_9SPHN|nr:hypothetical protein [Sphingomonas donggukensis]URW74836.1 hypothetical protein M9980_09680 [Sphingomonas donggukensis]